MLSLLNPIGRSEIKDILYEEDNIVYCGKNEEFITKIYFRVNDEYFLKKETFYNEKELEKIINYFEIIDEKINTEICTCLYGLNRNYEMYSNYGSWDLRFIEDGAIIRRLKCQNCIKYIDCVNNIIQESFNSLISNKTSDLTYQQIYNEQFKLENPIKCNCNDKLKIFRIKNNAGLTIKEYNNGKLIINIKKNKNSFDLNRNLFVKRNKLGGLTSITKDNTLLLKIRRYKNQIIEYRDYHGNYYNKKAFKNKCLLDGEDIFYDLVKK